MDLRSSEARRLQQVVHKSWRDFVNAKRNYDFALSTAIDTRFSSDGAMGSRIASRDRRSLERYSSAVNQWAEYLQVSNHEHQT
jgi:hypothetical protein